MDDEDDDYDGGLPDGEERAEEGGIVRRTLAQMRELARTVGWLVDASRGSRGRISRIVALDILSSAGWVVALAGLFHLLRALEKDRPFVLGPIELSLEHGAVEVLALCGTLAVIGGGAATLNFVARRYSAELCSELVVGLRDRVLAVVSNREHSAWRAMVVGAPKKWVRALVAAAPPMAGLGLWSFLKSLLPFGLMIGTAIYLLALDPLLTALLVPMLVPYVASLAVVWAGVTRSRRRYLTISGVAMRPIIDAFGVVIKRDAKPRLLDDVAKALALPAHRESVDLLFELRLVMQRVRMVNGVFSIAAVAAVLAFYIPLIDTTDRSWSDPLAYIVAMRLMLHNAQEVSSGLAMISRRVPEIDRLARFLAYEGLRGPDPTVVPTTPVPTDDLALEGDA